LSLSEFVGLIGKDEQDDEEDSGDDTFPKGDFLINKDDPEPDISEDGIGACSRRST
jgi:hypothetical protein